MNLTNESEHLNIFLYKIYSLLSYNNNYLKSQYINDNSIYINITELSLFKEKELYYNDNIEYYLKAMDDYNTYQIYYNNLISKYNNIINNDIIIINLENINNYLLEVLDIISKKN